ncbi:uncharacterized protein [Leptinotarsa decemlineata]|uniref:uncharacterized protein n=1 Tax=Leptinotarsa decemlineata TaxID=7539 RepID=UPI003D308309
MKWFLLLLHLASVIGIYGIDAKAWRKRFILELSRPSFFNEANPLGNVEGAIAHECEVKDPSIRDYLEELLKETKKCVKSKDISETNLESFQTHFDNCTSKIRTKTTSCLPSGKEYFANLLLDYAKGIVNLTYKHEDLLESSEMAECMSKLKKDEQTRTIKSCIENYRRVEIPSSKTEACKEFVPIHKCLTDPIKSICDSKLSQLADDYLELAKNLCKV